MAAPPPLNHDTSSSSCSTPYISAPSSPKLITPDVYFSAPTSPTFFTSIHQEFNKNPSINGVSDSVIPFGWEEKPKHKLKLKPYDEDEEDEDEDEFAFDFSGQSEKSPELSAADELFCGGKIRPLLKPPPGIKTGFDDDRKSLVSPPRSQGKKIILGAFSPRQRNRVFNPFAVAVTGESRKQQGVQGCSNLKKTPLHGCTRSISPFTDQSDEDRKQKESNSSSTWCSFGGYYKKWKWRGLLSFQRVSQGNPLKSAVLSNKEDVKSSSFRSNGSTGSTSSSSSRRRRIGGGGAVSAHELNRDNSEELKRKTGLPYRQGFFGCFEI